jgi:hypothetical protein
VGVGFVTVDIVVSPMNPGAVGTLVGPVEAGGAIAAMSGVFLENP